MCQTPCILCPGPMPQLRLPAQVTLPVAPARGQQRTSEQKAHSLPATARPCSLLRAPLGSFLLFILSGSHTDTLQNSCTQHPIIRKSTLCLFYCFFKVDSSVCKYSEFCHLRILYTHMHTPQLCRPQSDKAKYSKGITQRSEWPLRVMSMNTAFC